MIYMIITPIVLVTPQTCRLMLCDASAKYLNSPDNTTITPTLEWPK
jgi:hypothetical protein